MSKITAEDRARYKSKFLTYLRAAQDQEAKHIRTPEGLLSVRELADKVEKNSPLGVKMLNNWIRNEQHRQAAQPGERTQDPSP